MTSTIKGGTLFVLTIVVWLLMSVGLNPVYGAIVILGTLLAFTVYEGIKARSILRTVVLVGLYSLIIILLRLHKI